MKKYQDNNAQWDASLEGLKGLEFSPPQSVWAEVEASLDARKRVRFAWISAILLFIVSFGAYLLWPESSVGKMSKVGKELELSQTAESAALMGVGEKKSVSGEFQKSLEKEVQEAVASSEKTISIPHETAADEGLVRGNDEVGTPKGIQSKSQGNRAGKSMGSENVRQNSGYSAVQYERIAQENTDFINRNRTETASLSSIPTMSVGNVEWETPTLDQLRLPIKPVKRKGENRLALSIGAGTFNQNLKVANVQADSIAFYARPGAQFQASLAYAVNANLSIEAGIGYSYNTWVSPARLVVTPTTDILPASSDTVVFISTPYVFNEVTDAAQMQGLLQNYNPDQEVRLEHAMRYLNYRVGIAYKLVDYRKLSFHMLLQADYLRILSYSGRFETASYSMEYPVNGFRSNILGIRPGIGLSYRLIPGLQLFTEAATVIRSGHLLSQPGWRLYENPYGLVAGIRFGW